MPGSPGSGVNQSGQLLREQQSRLPVEGEILSLHVAVVLVHALDQLSAVRGGAVDLVVDIQIAERPIDTVGVGAGRVFLDLLEDPQLGLVVMPGDDYARVEIQQLADRGPPPHPPLHVALDRPQVAVVEGHIRRARDSDRGDPDHGVVYAVALPAVREQQLLALQFETRLMERHGDRRLGGDVGTETVDGPHVDLVTGGEHHVLDHAGQGHDLGLREGVRAARPGRSDDRGGSATRRYG